MIILQTNGISKSFGIETILSDINIQIHTNDRIGLVGLNGAGKSTLVKIITSEIPTDTGNVNISKGIKIGYLAQNSMLDTEKTIWNEMISLFSELIKKEINIRELELKMSDSNYTSNSKKYEKLVNEYSRLAADFKDEGGYSYEAKIRGVLHGLNFNSIDYHKQFVNTLSGGQKTRLAMAKLLLEEPDLLILDEPTNYLDIETMTWLENYLRSYPGAILIVSHDRYFLDLLVNTIYEIEATEAYKYVGNYSQYIEQKNALIEQQVKQFTKQQSEIKKMEDFVQKNIARASTTKRAQSKRKALEKIDKMDRPKNSKNVSFSFNTDTKSGNNVILLKDLSMSFDNKTIFNNVSFNIKKGERVALIGPNGIGKSTILKLINNKLAPSSGTIEFGSNIKIGYYDQQQYDLNLEKSILDELWDDYPELSEKDVRTTLGNFLFFNEDVFKKIDNLSGGEKARVNLAKLMLKNSNLLLLDEPTNHLDTYSREVLENAILDYSGTILFVSHDRYFLNRISTRTIELSLSGVTNYLGNYDYYIEKKADLEENVIENPNTKYEKSDKDCYRGEREKISIQRQLNRKLELLEKEIKELEENIVDIELQLTNEEVFSDHQLTYQKHKELEKIKMDLEALLDKWELIQLELES
ncbi:MAG: ABC-F family ATP-binding cassette domain-containing protein [Vulcanibacillus sp.]